MNTTTTLGTDAQIDAYTHCVMCRAPYRFEPMRPESLVPHLFCTNPECGHLTSLNRVAETTWAQELADSGWTDTWAAMDARRAQAKAVAGRSETGAPARQKVGPYANLSDRDLVQRYDAEARERWTSHDDALLSSGRMDDMHAELLARGLDWEDPRYFA